jgi:hypothetical protein
MLWLSIRVRITRGVARARDPVGGKNGVVEAAGCVGAAAVQYGSAVQASVHYFDEFIVAGAIPQRDVCGGGGSARVAGSEDGTVEDVSQIQAVDFFGEFLDRVVVELDVCHAHIFKIAGHACFLRVVGDAVLVASYIAVVCFCASGIILRGGFVRWRLSG